MPRGERAGEGSRSRARVASVVVPFPRRGRPSERLDLAGLVPSGRTLLLAFGIVLASLGGWWAAKESSLFAMRRVEVSGAPARVSRQVERALRTELGTSLLELDARRVQNRLLELPTVRSATLDRAFPNTLRVDVVPERPVAVIRQGAEAWLISARGRVMDHVARRAHRDLPRIWATRSTRLERGSWVSGRPRTAVAAVAPRAAAALPGRVARVRARPGELTLLLGSGVEVRLGALAEIRLKLAVATRILPLIGAETTYVDVSVPERPVAGTSLNSQVEVESTTSTSA